MDDLGLRWPSEDRAVNKQSSPIVEEKKEPKSSLSPLSVPEQPGFAKPKKQTHHVAFPPLPLNLKKEVPPRTDTCELPDILGRERSSSTFSGLHLLVNDSVFHPNSNFRYQWDITTLALMFIVVIDVPFTACFDVQSNGWDWHYIMSFIIDLFFMTDVLLNFNTAFEHDGIMQYDRRAIAWHYLTSWFIIDVASALPLDLMLNGSGSSDVFAGLSRLTRLVKMLKLIRLLRIARVMRVIARIEYTMHTPDNVRTLWKFLCVVLVCAHLFTCIFYVIGVTYNGKDEWANGVDAGLDTIFSKYVAGFYWAIMTITTIGYGDISSNGTAQRLFGLLAMIIGALLFGYGVSNVTQIIEDLRADERTFRETMDQFNVYMRSNDISLELQEKVREYLKNVKRAESQHMSTSTELGLLSRLSPGIQHELASAMHNKRLKLYPQFVGLEPAVVLDLTTSMEPLYLAPCEDITMEGEVGREMYFLLEGEVEVIANDAHIVLRARSCFGERALIEPNHVRTALTRTVTFCELRRLTADMLRMIIDRHPNSGVESFLNRITDKRLKRRKNGGNQQFPMPDIFRKRSLSQSIRNRARSLSGDAKDIIYGHKRGDSFEEDIELPPMSPSSAHNDLHSHHGEMSKVIVTNDEFSKSVNTTQLIKSLMDMQKEMSRISDRFDKMEARFDSLNQNMVRIAPATVADTGFEQGKYERTL